jgi:hypothetical protein
MIMIKTNCFLTTISQKAKTLNFPMTLSEDRRNPVTLVKFEK